MIDVADVTTELATLTAYVGGFSLLVLGAYGVRYGFRAGWNAVKSAFGITAKAPKTG